MKILISILLIIIVFLLELIRRQQNYIKIQRVNYEKHLKEWKWRYGICHNMRRLLFFSNRMDKIEKFMLEQNINKIAVYGMGIVGKSFIEQMGTTNIQVCYGIDSKKVNAEIEVRELKDVANDIDIIIVTEETEYLMVKTELSGKIKVPIVMLSQFLDEVYLVRDDNM